MHPISPSLTASSSTTAFHADQEQNLEKMTDFSELFDFDQFEAASSSHSHSPKTISPNHTPSPLPMSGLSPFAVSPSFDFRNLDTSINDYDMTQLDFAAQTESKPLPVQDDFVVKQEPVEFGFNTLPAPPSAPIDNGFSLAGLHPDQQKALQELLVNMMQYQNKYGADLPAAATPVAMAVPSPAPNFNTISPDLIFGGVSDSSFSSAGPSTLVTPTPPAALPISAPITVDASAPMMEEHDDEQLLTVEEADAARAMRHGSIVSSGFDDLDSKIDSLVPLPTIFSTGRGKGGKKGGGMSSVVRGDDEELDDDDSWRPSPEEYKKLSSKEKRQLRNKLSARAFRNRRKDYIGTLESHIKDRDTVIDAIKAELVNSRSENQDLRRELEALKSNTMAILHPDTANVKSESLPMKAAIAAAPTLAAAAGPSQPIRRAPTPKFNVRKDVPSSPAAFNLWNNSDYLSGGSTICHTALTPDIVMADEKAGSSKTPVPLRTLADLPRMNMNPMLNDNAPRMPSLSTTANSKDLNNTFSDWSENTPFTLRSMDSYRIQMWSRLAREASSDKAQVPLDSRPKFFVESAYTQAASTHISSKLASSFWSAFAGPSTGKLDSDKLAAVVTGKAKLKVVDVNEKDEAELLVAALSGLRLQSGLSRSEGSGLRARENPLAALSSFFRCPGACPQRA